MRFWLPFFFALSLFGQTAPKPDPLGRDNPRSAVTNFLEACQDRDYAKAAEFLDLSAIPGAERAKQGPKLAQLLEAALNADPQFSVLRLSRDPQGNPSDDADPNREHIATATKDGKPVTLDLTRVTPSAGGAPIWVFAADTVANLPHLTVSSTSSAIARRLPPFFSNVQILGTPLWKWIALILSVVVLVSISRLFDRATTAVVRAAAERFHLGSHVAWVQAMLAPVRVLIALILFRIVLELTDPSAIARLYIGRVAQALFVGSVVWCLMRLVELLFWRAESRMDENRRFASRSVLYLGRRTINATIAILGILLVLSNWGYNTATLVAGLGVGGIAIALAAQQTISNIFGGISVIADHPIRIGEYGKFGDLLGTLEDIGLRSTRIRTLSRTIVSVPNATFAGYNLENYGSRDKILFNPTLAVKRGTPEDQVAAFMESLRKMLKEHQEVETVATPVRIVGLSATAVNIEIFCYVQTRDISRFYTIQGDLYLAINRVVEAAKIELA